MSEMHVAGRVFHAFFRMEQQNLKSLIKIFIMIKFC